MFKLRTRLALNRTQTSEVWVVGARMLLCACVLCLASCVFSVSTACAADIYYSVGTDTSDLKAAATVTITGGNTATFSAGQPENIGIGDRITYNTSSVAHITSRISDTQFTISNAQGDIVADGGPWTVNSITRTFNSLNNAVNVAAIPNASNTAYLDTVDLISGPYTLYIVCYGDTDADTTPVTVGGWITDAVSTIRIIPSNQMRYKGRWDSGAYRLAVSSGDALTVLDDNIHISGLQISLSGSADDGIVSVSGNDELFVSDTILFYAGANPPSSAGILLNDSGSPNVSVHVRNNIIYNFLGTDNAALEVSFSGAGSKAYVYNNTFYNNTVGIDNVSGASTIVARNNIAYWNGDNYGGLGTFDVSSSHNLSGPNTDAQIPGSNAQNGEAVAFMDVANGDFRLAPGDTAAQDNGIDLSTTFQTDIEGQLRGRQWDIGADERVARALSVKSDTNPIIVQLGNGTVVEDFQITFTDAAGGLDILKKGGYGTAWGSDLVPSGTLFSIGGESGTAAHSVVQKGAAEVIVKKVRSGVTSFYHIYPSGRIVLDASGAAAITVNQTTTFPEYADGISHTGGYHAYVDLVETASDASADYLSPDAPSIIAGTRVSDRALDYGQDGFQEGRGSYPVIAASASTIVDFDGSSQIRYQPALLLEEFFPRTPSSAVLSVYWDAEDTIASGQEVWSGSLTSVLTFSTGISGSAQVNDSASDYASLQTASNISDPGTLSLWVKSSSLTNPSANEYLLYADSGFNLYFDISGQLNFHIASGATLTYAVDVYDNAWHEITCTWDYTADTYSLYVDGKLGASSTSSYTVPVWDATMYMTAQDAAGASRFDGFIDELRIYDAVEAPTGHALLYSRLDSAADLSLPQVGRAGTAAGTVSFPAGVRGNGIFFDGSGEYASLPSSGNINALAGTLELWVKSAAVSNPSSNEQLFYAGTDFQLYFDAQGHINFKVNTAGTLTNSQDVYDATWHHVKVLWDYDQEQYFLYIDGNQVDANADSYSAPALEATMYVGAADDSDTNRYNGQIDELAIYDACVFPYGAFYVPSAWGDASGKPDASVLFYWEADSGVLDLGAGSVTLGGSVTTAAGINGLCVVNGAGGDYVSFQSTGNMVEDEGSIGFWFQSAGTGNPSGTQYLFYATNTFNIFFDASGFLNFMIDSGVVLQSSSDVYDAKWHFVRVNWDYNNGLYELFVDGIKRDSSTDQAAAPSLGADIYLTASDAAGANRFDGNLDELYVTNSQATGQIATVYGEPVLPPQAAAEYAFRVETAASLAGSSLNSLLTPSSDFVLSMTPSSSTYVLQYLGNISTGVTPSLSNITATQNADTGNVTVSYTGTDPDDDSVLYLPEACLYSLDSTDGSNGTWAQMTSVEAGEDFTSAGSALSYVWDAQSDTNVYDSVVYLQLTVRDSTGHESVRVAIPPVSIDTLEPSGLGNFEIIGTDTNVIILSWDSVTDDNWLNDAHYEIYYGEDQADVQARSGTAVRWDETDDSRLTTRTTDSTTITGLASSTLYYFKIWAVDGFANEATLADISGSTAAPLPVGSRLYQVQIDSIYDAANDALLITTSLLKREGAVVSDLTDLTLTYVGVLDNTGTLLSGNLNGGSDTISSLTDAIFYTTWDSGTDLSANTSYTIVSKISYQGNDYSGLKTITVKELEVLAGETDDVVAQTVTLTTSVNNLDSMIDIVTEKIDQNEEEQVTFRDNRQPEMEAVSESVGSVRQNTSVELVEILEDSIEVETAKGVRSEIVTRGTTVASGATVPILFRSDPGVSPTITVYDSRNVTRVSNGAMKEAGTTGMYSYELTFNTAWGTGDFTVLVQDPVSQAVDSILMNVTQGGDSSSSSSGSGVSSSTSADVVYSRLTTIGGDINTLLNGMSSINTTTGDVSGSIDALLKSLEEVQGSATLSEEAIASIAKATQELVGGDDSTGGVLEKLSDLEGMLEGIGPDAAGAAGLAVDSRSQVRTVRLIASRIQELLAAGDIEGAREELVNLAENLFGLKQNIDGVPGAVTADSLSGEVQWASDEVARLTAGTGLEGLTPSIGVISELGASTNPGDIIEIRNNVNELTSLMTEVRELLDQEINQPIVHGWLEGEE